ncbi:MAG: hypothetical protein MZW92_03095 [Comamonadaceae bacterium]|nr:hypothetical protein [Comamonadaceae bacterium]
MVRAYVRGYHDNGMLTSAKHFPGRGDVANMPAESRLGLDRQAGRRASRPRSSGPSSSGIDAGVDFVMTEHIAVPSVAGRLGAAGERREEAGHRTGSRASSASRASSPRTTSGTTTSSTRFGAEEVAVQAFEAGHDVILKPKDPVGDDRRAGRGGALGARPESRGSTRPRASS